MANIITAPESGIYFDGNTAGVSSIPTLTGDASGVAIQYDGYAGIEINSSATGANYLDRFSVEGANGRLFGVTDEVTGTVFSVNDAAGLPIIEVESTSDYDKITIGEYGTDALVVSGDSVGIGTTNPSAKLDVAGTVKATSYFLGSSSEISLATTGAGNVFLRPNGQSTSGQMQLESSGNAIFAGNISIPQPKAFTFANSQTIRDNGGGGLAIRVPIYRLDLIAGTNAGNGHITFQTNNGTERMRVSNGGNVGIGTTSPIDPLNVQSTGSNEYAFRVFRSTSATQGLGGFYEGGANQGQLWLLKGDNSAGVMVNSNGDSYFNGGNVGIGTTSPSSKLEVVEATANTAARITVDSASWDASLSLKNANGTWEIINDYTGAGTTGALAFWNGSYRMAIDNTGNVGIGTTSPQNKLHVEGSFNGGIQIEIDNQNTGNASYAGLLLRGQGNNFTLKNWGDQVPSYSNVTEFISTASSSSFAFSPSNSEAMRIASDGNVGIGDTTPSYKLDVNGTLRSTGAAYFNSTVEIGSSLNMTDGDITNGYNIYGNYFVQRAHGIPRNNLGAPTVTEMALFEPQFTCKTDLSNSYNDLSDLEFYVQSTSSSEWTEVTSYSDDQKRRFLRTNNSSVIIPNLSYKYRVEFNAQGYTYANALYMYWSSQSHSTQVHIWKQRASDDTWIQHTSSTNTVSSWPGHLWLPFSTIPWLEDPNSTSTGHYHKIRIEFTPNWSGHATYGDRDIILSGGQIWGGYPTGRRTPHYYDQNGLLTTWGQFKIGDIPSHSSEATALVVNTSNVVGYRELGSAAFSATSAFAAASHTHAASDITSGTLNAARLPRPINGDWWNGGAVIVGTDGVMEVGKYLDFHTADSGGGTDYDVRVTASNNAISVGGSLTATSLIKYGGTSSEFLKADGTVDSNTYATQSYVSTQVSNLVDSAPATLDTLNELAAALGDDASFSATMSTSLGNRLRVDISSQELSSTEQSNARTNLGLGTAATSASTAFAAASHTQAFSTITSTPTTLAGYGITDAASSSELSSHTSATNNPHSVTKTQVGLSNVTNESKATMFSAPTFTGGGNTVTLKKGSGNAALAFAGTSDEASALIEGVAGGGLRIYTSNGGTLNSPSWSTKMTIAAGGNTTFTGTVSAPNLTLTGLSNQSSEATALVKNGSNVVGYRELGSNAFNSTSYLPLAGGTMTGVLTLSQNNNLPLRITGSNSNYIAMLIANTGSGNAGVYYDAINGDLAGSDYGFIGQEDAGYMLYNIGASSPAPYHVFTGGNVGIGTTSPQAKLHVESKILISQDTGDRPKLAFSENVSNDDEFVIEYNGAGGGTGNYVAFYSDISTWTNIGDGLNFIPANGRVGIGTTSPDQKLEVASGHILVSNNYDYRGTDTGGNERTLVRINSSNEAEYGSSLAGPVKFMGGGSYTERMRIHTNGNVGIGTTSPSYKLDVAASGGIRAGGKTTYTKNFASGLTTSGEVVAEVTTGYNGASALFEFTCFGGNAGCYQKVIWSLYNASGTWYASNPINEGTNHYDVTYSSGEFTFKTRSGTQAYQPRVIVEAAGDSIDNSYA
jgi:hypothetical protein